MTMPAPLSALLACEYPPTTPVVPFTASEGYGRECYDAGRASAAPVWSEMTPETAATLVPRQFYWVMIPSRAEPQVTRYSNDYGGVFYIASSAITRLRGVTHFAPMTTPGAPA